MAFCAVATVAFGGTEILKRSADNLPNEFYEVWVREVGPDGTTGTFQKVSPILRDVTVDNVREPHPVNITGAPGELQSYSILPNVWTR